MVLHYIQSILFSIYSFVILFLLSKFIGSRQISQLSLFDYINGITIGSIAAELTLADNLEQAAVCTIAMIIYVIAVIVFSVISDKSIHARKFIEGTPKILFMNGQFYASNFHKCRIDLSEFFMQLRSKGYFDVTQISMAIFEANGTISILPTAVSRPATPEDFNLNPPTEPAPYAVIMDGIIITQNLRQLGMTKQEFLLRLKQQSWNNVKDIFLATMTWQGEITVYPKRAISSKEIPHKQ